MTGPRIPTVYPHRRRARHLLPFLLAIVASAPACTGDQPTAPAFEGSGPSISATRWHPNLASKAGQSGSIALAMRAAMSRSSMSMAAAVLPPSTGTNVLILADVDGPPTTALANSIVNAGFHVAVKRAPEFNWFGSNPALDGYDVVIHLNGFTYNIPLASSAQSTLRTFVSNGGGFVGSQLNGYEELVSQQFEMPELVLLGTGADSAEGCGPCEVTYARVPGQESHPMLAGLPPSFPIQADGHDASPKLGADPSTVVLMRVQMGSNPDSIGGPAVLASQFGSGKVVNFSFAPNYAELQVDRHTLEDANVQALYINAVRWLSGSAGNPGAGTLDSDADAILDGTDNCVYNENSDQLNTDGDALGDSCDPDDDGDTVLDGDDNCPLVANTDQADADGDWIGDVCDEAQTLAQTIIFNTLSDKTFGDPVFTVSAIAIRADGEPSGLPVNFLVSGDCTITGSTIALTAAGTCTVYAQQPGNTVYTFAEDVVRSFNIAKAPAVITVGTDFTYDGTIKQATVTTNPAGLNGVTVTYTLAGSPLAQPINAGVYQVLATLDNPNYQAPATTGTLTINQAVPVVQWASPAAVTAGTELSTIQLNATATGVGGIPLLNTFTYLPGLGTKLTAQPPVQPLSVEFVSADGNYTKIIKTVSITVTPVVVPPTTSGLTFRGFFRPVHNLPVVNRTKAGRAIPVKFAVEGSRGLRVLQSGSPTSVPTSCSGALSERTVEQTVEAAASSLRVSGTSYTYLWKTSSTWAGTCRKLVVTLVDGSRHEAIFHFVKTPRRGHNDGDDRDKGKDRDEPSRHESRDNHDSGDKHPSREGHKSGKGNDSRGRK